MSLLAKIAIGAALLCMVSANKSIHPSIHCKTGTGCAAEHDETSLVQKQTVMKHGALRDHPEVHDEDRFDMADNKAEVEDGEAMADDEAEADEGPRWSRNTECAGKYTGDNGVLICNWDAFMVGMTPKDCSNPDKTVAEKFILKGNGGEVFWVLKIGLKQMHKKGKFHRTCYTAQEIEDMETRGRATQHELDVLHSIKAEPSETDGAGLLLKQTDMKLGAEHGLPEVDNEDRFDVADNTAEVEDGEDVADDKAYLPFPGSKKRECSGTDVTLGDPSVFCYWNPSWVAMDPKDCGSDPGDPKTGEGYHDNTDTVKKFVLADYEQTGGYEKGYLVYIKLLMDYNDLKKDGKVQKLGHMAQIKGPCFERDQKTKFQ